MGTAVEDFVCVFHNMEYMKCNWGISQKMPADSQQTLYFWYVIYPIKTILAPSTEFSLSTTLVKKIYLSNNKQLGYFHYYCIDSCEMLH